MWKSGFIVGFVWLALSAYAYWFNHTQLELCFQVAGTFLGQLTYFFNPQAFAGCEINARNEAISLFLVIGAIAVIIYSSLKK